MNSKQRRKHSRKFKYSVRTEIKSYEQYCLMFDWLTRKHGNVISKCKWRRRHHEAYLGGVYVIIWEFVRERDSIEFSLSWL